jgi:2'-5' RNA ligase
LPRIFIAALLPDHIRREISRVLKNADESFSGVRWEKAEKIHITLKFVGSVKNKTKDDILWKVKNIAKNTQPITICFSHIDAFPDFRRPRVLVLRLSNSKDLHDLFTSIEDNFFEMEIEKEERNFIPHITIGRIKKGFRIKEKALKIEKKDFVIDHIAVVQSELKKEGSEYINLGVYKLS